MPTGSRKRVLVVDDQKQFWESVVRRQVEDAGAGFTVVSLNELGQSPPCSFGFDIAILHDTPGRSATQGQTTPDLLRDFLATQREHPPSIYLLDNAIDSKDRHSTLVTRQREWKRVGLDVFGLPLDILQLNEITGAFLLQLCDPYTRDPDNLPMGALEKAAVPIRLVDDIRRLYNTNSKWPTDQAHPTPPITDETGIIYLDPQVSDDGTKVYQIFEEQTDHEVGSSIRLQTAVPITNRSMKTERDVVEDLMLMLQGFGFRRCRYYRIFEVPGMTPSVGGTEEKSLPPLLDLCFAIGHEAEPTEEDLEDAIACPDGQNSVTLDRVFAGVLCGSMVSFWLDEETHGMLSSLEQRANKNREEALAGAATEAQDDPHSSTKNLVMGIASRPPVEGSASEAMHHLLRVSHEDKPVYLPVFMASEEVPEPKLQLRALLVIDSGHNSTPSEAAMDGLYRSRERVKGHLKTLKGIIAEQRGAELHANRIEAFEFLKKNGHFPATHRDFKRFRHEFLEACRKKGGFTLASIAWRRDEESQPRVRDILADKSVYSTAEIKSMHALENKAITGDRLPALFGAISTSQDYFYHEPLDDSSFPHDLNGYRPRFAMPLKLAEDETVLGAVGLSKQAGLRPFLRMDVERIRALMRLVSPVIYLIDGMLMRSLARHTISHELEFLRGALLQLINDVPPETRVQLDESLELMRDASLAEVRSDSLQFQPLEELKSVIMPAYDFANANRKILIEGPHDPNLEGRKAAGNAARFRLCARNVLRNASKHGTQKSRLSSFRIEVQTSTKLVGGKLQFEVSNPGRLADYPSGVKIPKEYFDVSREDQQMPGVLISMEYARNEGGELAFRNVLNGENWFVHARLRWPLEAQPEKKKE